jgi:hypothetical protein
MTSRISSSHLRFLACGLVAALGLPTSPAHAAGDIFGVEVSPWMQALQGEVAIDKGTVEGTEADLEENLGMTPEETAPFGRLWLRWGRTRLLLDYAEASRDGSEVLDQDLTFHGMTFGAAEKVSTDLSMKLYGASVEVALLNADRLRIGLSSGINVAGIDIAVQGASTGDERFQDNLYFPTFGAFLFANPIGGFAIRGEVIGFALALSGDDVSVIDGRVQLEYYFLHSIGIMGGYRLSTSDLDVENFGVIRTDSSGPYVGLGFKL